MGNLLCVPRRPEEAGKAGPTAPRKKRNVRHWFRKKVLKRRSGVAVPLFYVVPMKTGPTATLYKQLTPTTPPSALSPDEYDDASSTDYDEEGLPSYREVNLATLPCSMPCEERDEVTHPQSRSLVVRSPRHVVVSSPSLDTIFKAAVAFLSASSLSVHTTEHKSITRSRSVVVVTIRTVPPQPSSSLTSAVGFASRSRLGCVILAGVVPSETSVVVSTAVLSVTCTAPSICTTSVVRSVNVAPQSSFLPLPGSSRPALTWERSAGVAVSPPRIPDFLVQTSLSVSTPPMSPSPESPISGLATGRIPSLTCMALTWRPSTSLTSLPEIPSSLLMPSGRPRVVGCMQPPPSPDLSTPSPWTPSASPPEFPSLPSSPLVPDTSSHSSPELPSPRPDPPPGLSGIQNSLVPPVQLMSRHTEPNQGLTEFSKTVQNSMTDRCVKSPTHFSTQSNELVPHISTRESVSTTVNSIHTVQSTSVYVPSVQQTLGERWSTSEDASSKRETGEANRCEQTNKVNPGQLNKTTSNGTTNCIKGSQASEDGLPWSQVLSNQSAVKLNGVSSLNNETTSSTEESHKVWTSSKRQATVLGPIISHNRPIPAIPRTAGSATTALKDIPSNVGPRLGPSTSRNIGQTLSSNTIKGSIQKRYGQQQQMPNSNRSKEVLKTVGLMDTGREQSVAQCQDHRDNFVNTGGHVPQPPSIPRPDQTFSSRRQVKMTECKKDKNKDAHVNSVSKSNQQNSYNKDIENLPSKIIKGEKVKKSKEAVGPPVNDRNTDSRPKPSKEFKSPSSPKPQPAMDAMNSKTFISSVTGRQQQAPPRLSAVGMRTSDPVANPANAFPAIPGCSHTGVTQDRKDTVSLTTFREREVDHEDQVQKTQSVSNRMRDMFEQKRRMRFKVRDQDVLMSPPKKLLSSRQNIQLPSCNTASQKSSTGSGTSFPPIGNSNTHCHPVPSTSQQTPSIQHVFMGQRSQEQEERDQTHHSPTAGSEPALQQFQSMCRLMTRFTNDSHTGIIRQDSPRSRDYDLSRQSGATTRASPAQDSAISNEQLKNFKPEVMKSSRAGTVSKEHRNDKRNSDTVLKANDMPRKGRFEGRSSNEKEFIKKVADKMSDFVIRPKTPRYFAFRRNRPPPTRRESKVSEFKLPERPATKSSEPLELKDPEPHINNIPEVAREDAQKCKNWTQVEGKGPDAQQPWTNRRPLFDVAFPKLGPGLLKQRGSIQKIEDEGVIPYGRQMEHLKLELCKFPGKRIPMALREQYKVPEWAKPKPPKRNPDGTEQQEVDDDSDSDSEATGSTDAQSLEDIVADDVFNDEEGTHEET